MPEPDDPLEVLEARALALLARREYTRAELARRLARLPAPRRPRTPVAGDFAPPPGTRWPDPADEFAPPPPHRADPAGDSSDPDVAEAPTHRLLQEHIAIVIDRLAGRGLLSDARAAEAIVHARARQRGLLRVRQEMAQRGVPEDVATGALAGLREQQVPLAREVWRKRFGALPGDAAERARQTRFLAARGFSFEVIRVVLGGDDTD